LILEVIENEEMVVLENGKRKPMRKVEIQLRLHFTKGINGNLESARLLVSMAEEYFTADASPTGIESSVWRKQSGVSAATGRRKFKS
jgi:hypothetical protein